MKSANSTLAAGPDGHPNPHPNGPGNYTSFADATGEWPEILRWMIEGCIDWQQNGLCRPEIVRDATNEYFEVQDTFKQWLDEKCIVQHGNPNRKATAQDLFASWGQFAIINSEPAGNMKGFGERMDRLGFKKNKNIPAKSGSGKARGYEGIELNTPTSSTARP